MTGLNFNLFENFTLEYDQMIPWESRLLREKPFFEKTFQETGAKRVLDLACGTGKHALMFSQWGIDVVGMDQSEAMVKRARQNAREMGIAAVFEQGDFLGFLANLMALDSPLKPFDTVLILGNSLPHLLSLDELNQTLVNIREVLDERGRLIIQNRNYDKILAEKNRFMPPNSWRQGDEEKIFFRFTDFEGERVTFNIVTFTRVGEQWVHQVQSNHLWPMQAKEMDQALKEAGFKKFQFYGNFAFEPFDPQKSNDLIIIAEK